MNKENRIPQIQNAMTAKKFFTSSLRGIFPDKNPHIRVLGRCFIHDNIIIQSLYMGLSVCSAGSDKLQITELLRFGKIYSYVLHCHIMIEIPLVNTPDILSELLAEFRPLFDRRQFSRFISSSWVFVRSHNGRNIPYGRV